MSYVQWSIKRFLIYCVGFSECSTITSKHKQKYLCQYFCLHIGFWEIKLSFKMQIVFLAPTFSFKLVTNPSLISKKTCFRGLVRSEQHLHFWAQVASSGFESTWESSLGKAAPVLSAPSPSSKWGAVYFYFYFYFYF